MIIYSHNSTGRFPESLERMIRKQGWALVLPRREKCWTEDMAEEFR